MIELTREEVLSILKAFYLVEGAMLQGGLKAKTGEYLDPPVKILAEKLINDKA